MSKFGTNLLHRACLLVLLALDTALFLSFVTMFVVLHGLYLILTSAMAEANSRHAIFRCAPPPSSFAQVCWHTNRALLRSLSTFLFHPSLLF